MLNERQREFCRYYLELGNAHQAALRAGYSESYARGASKLAARPEMRAYMDELIQNMDGDRVAKAEEVLATLTSVLRREMRDRVVSAKRERKTYYDESGQKCTVVEERPEVLDAPARISDVNRAAELLARRYGLLSDKVDLDVGELVVRVDYGDSSTGE